MEKLQNGDYCVMLTKEQFDELIEIQGDEFKPKYDKRFQVLGYDGEGLYSFSFDDKQLLPFDEFKKRAINTFRK